MKTNKGFTLVELIAVISILAIVLLILVPTIGNLADNSKNTLKQSRIKMIETASQKYGNININDYQICKGPKDALENTICVSDVGVIVDELLSLGLVSGKNKDEVLSDPTTNDKIKGQILFCYNSNDISVNAQLLEYSDDNEGVYSCSDESGNYLRLAESASIGYRNSTKSINIIHIGEIDHFSCNYNASGINVSCNNDKLEININNLAQFGSYTIPLNAFYKDGSQLSTNYYLDVKDVKFELNTNTISEDGFICLSTSESKEIEFLTENTGNISILNNTNSNIIEASIRNGKLYIAGKNSGTREIEVHEENSKKSINVNANVYDVSFRNGLPNSLLVNEVVKVNLNVSGIDNIEVAASENIYIQNITSSSFEIKGLSPGKADIIITGIKSDHTCFVETFSTEVKHTSLSLNDHEAEMYIGGEPFTTVINTDNQDDLSWTSSDENAARAEINGNVLTIYPVETANDNVIITVKVKDVLSDTVRITVKKVDINFYDQNNQLIEDNICSEITSTTPNIIRAEGNEIGSIERSIETDNDWCLADVNITNQNISLAHRHNTLDEASVYSTTCSSYIQNNNNTGRATVKLIETNSNIPTVLHYNIYKLELSSTSGNVDLNNTSTFTINYSYTGDETAPEVRSLDESIATVSVSNPRIISGQPNHVANYERQVTVTITGRRIGDTTIVVEGAICGRGDARKEYAVTVKGNSSCPSITSYEGIYDGNNHTVTINEGVSNGTIIYSLDNGNETSVLPSTSSVGNHTLSVRVEGNHLYNGRTCTSSTITINNAKITFDYSNYGGTLNGSNELYARTGNSNLYDGIRSSRIASKPTISKVGYDFNGWADQNGNIIIDGNGNLKTNSTYTSSGKWNITQDITLYASMSRKTFTLSYNANGGTGEPNSQTITYGLDYTLSSIEPTREGYKFIGWNDDSNSNIAIYSPGDTLSYNYKNYTLYAIWEMKALDNKNYNVGEEVDLFNLKWLVVKDETDNTTLVLKNNYTTGIYGSSTAFTNSTVYNYLNSTFINNNDSIKNAINANMLVRQGTYNGSNYFVRLLKSNELSDKLPLSSTTNGSVFWTMSDNESNIYLGDSTGKSANAYFTDANKGTIDLYAHQYSSYESGSMGYVQDVILNVASENNYWTSVSGSTLLASPNVSSISYYSSNAYTSGSGCSTKTTLSLIGCYADWSRSGRHTIYYTQYVGGNTTGSTNNYYNLSRASTADICVQGQANPVTVYYATEYTQCNLPIFAFSSYYSSMSLPLATNPVTYYIPTGTATTTNIGYRPVITVYKS